MHSFPSGTAIQIIIQEEPKNLKGESALHAILLSHINASYSTSRFFISMLDKHVLSVYILPFLPEPRNLKGELSLSLTTT